MDNMKLAEIMRRTRFEKGMTIAAAAKASNISRETWATAEEGSTRVLHTSTVFAICKGLGMSYDDMCEQLGFYGE